MPQAKMFYYKEKLRRAISHKNNGEHSVIKTSYKINQTTRKAVLKYPLSKKVTILRLYLARKTFLNLQISTFCLLLGYGA